ncbi:MAG: c-type cytochrome, partial [Phycisphaerae bacterium]
MICLITLVGCNTNAGDILLNSGSATGRTLFDLWLTSAANGFANLLNPPPATDSGGGGDTGSGGDTGGSGDLTGDATAGAQTFADNCAVCHAADGTGDIGPNITGVSA